VAAEAEGGVNAGTALSSTDPRDDHTAGRPQWILLVSLILTWAVSWPAIKVGVATVTPLWYACFRYVIAACCLFAIAFARRRVSFPPRSDWPLVVASAGLQMAAYSALTGIALTILPPGRASVLAFSTPIWVVPLASWRLGERVSRRAMLGIALGLLGVFAIAAPSLQPSGARQMAAYLMLFGAAAVWAISIVIVRGHRFASTALALAPWQMLVPAGLLLALAIAFEGGPPPLGGGAAASLAYVGPVATAFAYWAVVEAGRRVRASTLSMALLATPALGVLVSALALKEEVGASLIAGGTLIGAGIRLATRD
jgi:drug/metabolite transporter (DMT)-like permease